MANYVDGFVLPLPKKNIKAYTKMAKLAGKVWLEYGALEYIECMADDVLPGKLTSFPQSVKLKSNEIHKKFISCEENRCHGIDADMFKQILRSIPSLKSENIVRGKTDKAVYTIVGYKFVA